MQPTLTCAAKLLSMIQSPIRVIATDEAGYGPKLGPLVIGATAYCVDAVSQDDLVQHFAPLSQPHRVNDAVVLVNDSKTVFKPKSAIGARRDPLANLHATVSVANAWCSDSSRNDSSRNDSTSKHSTSDLASWLKETASQDWDDIKQSPWLAEIQQVEFLNGSEIESVVKSWSDAGIQLTGVQCRAITAAKFNAACREGRNKADLLSQSTLGLVRDLLHKPTSAAETRVYCDRHGGRRYYAGVLTDVLRGAEVEVISESKAESSYRVKYQGHASEFHFTVKGDSFAPVALSSIYAKYIRERSMQSFNRYFATIHREPLKPTAGYPSDANRFLQDIAPTLRREKIADGELIRVR